MAIATSGYRIETFEKALDSQRAFECIAHEDWAVWLDSGLSGQVGESRGRGRCDIIACQPIVTLETKGEVTRIVSTSRRELSFECPYELLKRELSRLPEGFEGYGCGGIGYFAYDLSRRYVRLEAKGNNSLGLPELAIGVYAAVVVVDHHSSCTKLIYWEACPDETVARLRRCIRNGLNQTEARQHNAPWLGAIERTDRCIDENMSFSEYTSKFERIMDYIFSGDCYQVNLTKAFSVKLSVSAWETYKYLRGISPAPYGAYLKYPFASVLSNSPEAFLSCNERRVSTYPIKGTVKRDLSDVHRDAELAMWLVSSGKNRSENLMIVDLMRNDLAMFCEVGSITVPKLFELQSYANVHHLVSCVEGMLDRSRHVLDALRMSSPGGSVTGAPKIRAMEIIEEVEPTRRGVYCGSIAFVGSNQRMESNIAIRTITVKGNQAYFSAGGGVVSESTPDDEYAEISHKARMMEKAMSLEHSRMEVAQPIRQLVGSR